MKTTLKLLMLTALIWINGCEGQNAPTTTTVDKNQTIPLDENKTIIDQNETIIDENQTMPSDENNTIVDENESIIDNNNTVVDENQTIPLDENKTIIDQNETIIDENQTMPSDENNTIVDENETVIDSNQTIPSENNTTAIDQNKTMYKDETPIDDNETIDQSPKVLSAEWYMKTVVSATASDGTEYTHDRAGIFGALQESSDGYDRHDILVYGTAILQVIFPRPEWGEQKGNYASDYHAVKAAGEKDVWTFQIKNQRDVNLKNAPIKLTLVGPYDVVLQEDGMAYEERVSSDSSRKTDIKLVDVDNAIVYTYEELQSASLTMDGKNTRTFRWVLGEVEGDDYTPVPTTPVAASRQRSIPKPSGKFGLPPQ